MSNLARYNQFVDREKYITFNEVISFEDYLNKCLTNPKLLRNAFQYIYDMIVADGVTTFKRFRKTYRKFNFFTKHQTKVFGLEDKLEDIVDFLEGAAGNFGTQKRLLLLHGPVGSSKSTICRAIKQGLERYSRTDEGTWYTYRWINLPADVHVNPNVDAPLCEHPYKLMPLEMRQAFFKDANEVLLKQNKEKGEQPHVHTYDLRFEGELNPFCKLVMRELMKKYNGDWRKIVNEHIEVFRNFHSEADRVGVGTFQPKDEKNQDATELTGDINYRKIAHYGADSDPRAFNYDGEFQVGNRGMVEFIEALKLQTEFLYDLLEATQDHSIKPKKFARIQIDCFLVGHTNNPEYEKLRTDACMEALKDRTNKIDIPYLLRWSDELKVLEADYGPASGNVKQHIMPHTLEIAALFAVLTRLKDDPDQKLSLVDKAKLYDGRSLDTTSWTEDSVKELHDKYTDEGLKFGVSARYIQDCLSLAISRHKNYVNAFHVLHILKDRLRKSSLIPANLYDEYEKAWDLTVKELDEILKHEIQKALVADENVINRLAAKYIDNLVAYINNEKVKNPITGRDQEPDERLMRSIEEKIDVPEQGARDFRRSIVSSIGTLASRNEQFTWKSNPQLAKALENKVFDDAKDSIKLSALSSEASAVDPELQEKIDAIKTRLVKNFGYNEQSATDVLEYVSSLFAGVNN